MNALNRNCPARDEWEEHVSMTEETPWEPGSHQVRNHVHETDAVCQSCGMVNPEDTFHCRQCGNDLREQRLARLAMADPVQPQATATAQAKRWLGHLLVVFGLLLILWTAINMSNIEEWLAQAQTVPVGEPSGYWNGAGSAAYDAIAASLATMRASTAQVGDIAAPRNGYEGVYLLIQGDPVQGRRVGMAEVRAQGDGLIFVARFRGGLEIRGQGRVEDNTLVIDDAGGRLDDQYVGGKGFAQPLEGGGFRCYAVSDINDYSYELTALAVGPPTPPSTPES